MSFQEIFAFSGFFSGIWGGVRTVRAAVSAGIGARRRKSPWRDRSAGGSGEEKYACEG